MSVMTFGKETVSNTKALTKYDSEIKAFLKTVKLSKQWRPFIENQTEKVMTRGHSEINEPAHLGSSFFIPSNRFDLTLIPHYDG